jgi:hypothetical protein
VSRLVGPVDSSDSSQVFSVQTKHEGVSVAETITGRPRRLTQLRGAWCRGDGLQVTLQLACGFGTLTLETVWGATV